MSQLLRQANLETPSEIEFISAGFQKLRDRLDFSFLDGKCGLYSKNKLEIIDIQICSQLSPELQNWYEEFRQLGLPLKRASLRLRVNPDGIKGLWIDAANIDIKNLLEEKSFLQRALSVCEIEIGQRRKKPFWTGSEFKLKDPEHQVWFHSWAGPTPVPLYCQIASFTQPSHKANELICEHVGQLVRSLQPEKVIEFGSGIGNLTFAVAPFTKKITACEIDKMSLQGLQTSLEFLPESLCYLKDRIEIHAGDFQRRLQMDFSHYDCILANPPRSGLMGFIDSLAGLSPHKRPPNFVYMSCFPESFIQDSLRLKEVGYGITKLKIMDQFPQTQHYELIALLQRVERNS